MSDPMILPLEALSDACASQLLIVRREWPQGVPLTPLTAARCVELGLDLGWIAGHLLDDLALAEFERVRAPALADYVRVMAPRDADFKRVMAPVKAGKTLADAEYARVMALASAEFDRVMALALAEKTLADAEYARATAPALLDGVIQTLKRKGTR